MSAQPSGWRVKVISPAHDSSILSRNLEGIENLPLASRVIRGEPWNNCYYPKQKLQRQVSNFIHFFTTFLHFLDDADTNRPLNLVTTKLLFPK